MFPGIGVPPEPATEPHVVKKGGLQQPQRRVQGGLSGSPRVRAGTSKEQRSQTRRPPGPAGTVGAASRPGP